MMPSCIAGQRREAQEVRASDSRSGCRQCRLELHPEKTKIVYCKDDDRRGTSPHEKFDFLGYTFRPRRSKNRKGKFFINFSPAASGQSGQGDPGGDSQLAAALAQRQVARGFVPNVQPKGSGLAPILRAVLSLGAVSDRCVNWTVHWPAGPIGNTRSCVAICAGQRTGSPGFPGAIRGCLPTGRWACGGAP